ncbi:MAG: protein kinase [Mobilicoccus sp.]|nr:protein kinase [Mobilicoccus sp.]
MKFSTGAVFGNRYTLGERIAVGGMGEVWEATDQVLGRIVAIKLLSPALADQSGFAERFREEARNTAALSHPNIAAVYDYGEDAGANWLVMELVKGEPLSAILTEQGALTPERTIAIVAQAALALQAAHDRGVIHRDVKPANILVRPDGAVKLTDFGIARATDAAPITRTGEVMGTAQYISPEQATGQKVSPASDIYALGCVAHEMLTGRRAFDEGSPVATAMAHVTSPPPELPASVPEPLASVVMACLAKDPAHRPGSAKEVADALRGAPTAGFAATTRLGQAGATEKLTPATALAPPVAATGATRQVREDYQDEPEQSGSRWLLWLIVPLLIALIAVGAWFALGRDDQAEPPPPPATTAPETTPTEEETETPNTVTVTSSDYIGLTYDQAVARLSGLGLDPRRNDAPSSQPQGTVIGLSPSGTLEVGSIITLDVSEGPVEPTTPEEPATPDQTPEPAPQPETPDPTPPAPEETPAEPDTPPTGAAASPAPGSDVGGPAGAGVEVPTPDATDPTDDPPAQE